MIKRHLIHIIFLGFALMLNAAPAKADTAYAFSFPGLSGGTIDLSAHHGQPLLIVNTASQCGFTPQYDGLQALYERYQDAGLVVIGLPSNDFGRQEKGDAEEIKEFCEVNFNITFPMSDKITVKGDDAHPFYDWAVQKVGRLGKPRWNFHKFLIGRDGQIADWYASTTAPDSKKIQRAIEELL